ncbi:hypothetical protein ABRP52_20865 [Pectobacterium versatile]|uniref:hypothetical protein n=1 Tax=Pectobacterium TaxID=122277 RepID=UPI0015819D46|nr:hypothetical protein [Pectobacterium polaris]
MESFKISNNKDVVDVLDLVINKDFDKNSMQRIMGLYKLRDIVMGYLEEQECLTPPPEDGKIYKQNSIYSSLLHSIDVLIYNFINDESLVVLNGRDPLRLTMAVCVRGLVEDKYKFPRKDNAIKEIQNLYINRNDEIIGSMFLDFSVAIFSAFEVFLSEIYYIKSKKEKIANDEKYFRGNIPARKKITSVLNLCINSVNPITKQDEIKFMECIDVLREIRNTIHTLGIYTKNKEITYTINGMSVYLRKSRPVTTTDHRFDFFLCEEIINIYRKICFSLSVEQIKYIDLKV